MPSSSNYHNAVSEQHKFKKNNMRLYELGCQIKAHPALSLVNRGALYDYWFFHFNRNHEKAAEKMLQVLDSMINV